MVNIYNTCQKSGGRSGISVRDISQFMLLRRSHFGRSACMCSFQGNFHGTCVNTAALLTSSVCTLSMLVHQPVVNLPAWQTTPVQQPQPNSLLTRQHIHFHCQNSWKHSEKQSKFAHFDQPSTIALRLRMRSPTQTQQTSKFRKACNSILSVQLWRTFKWFHSQSHKKILALHCWTNEPRSCSNFLALPLLSVLLKVSVFVVGESEVPRVKTAQGRFHSTRPSSVWNSPWTDLTRGSSNSNPLTSLMISLSRGLLCTGGFTRGQNRGQQHPLADAG